MDHKDDPKIKQVQIEMEDKVGTGEYCNFVIVTHSPAEFVLDFTQIMPGLPKARVRSRIIIAPIHAKSFVAALSDNIKKYEERFGEIKVSKDEWARQFGFKLPPDTVPN